MQIPFQLTTFRILGTILVILGSLGLLTVADEGRHVGELQGVTTMMVAGLIFLLIDFRFPVFRRVALQWISICLLACIPIGGVWLDNMPVGIGIGLLSGILLALIVGRKSN